MKKILIYLIGVTLIVVLATVVVYTYQNKYELIAQIKDILHIKPQQYFGATVDMSQILPESQHYVVNSKGQDLINLGANLGMNTLRITNINTIKDGITTPYYTHTQWAEVLNKMKQKKMYAIVLIEANAQDSKFNRRNLDDYYLNFVKNYITNSDICSFPNVLAIDIANEPILTHNNLIKLKQASQIVKEACPSMKVTIGSWAIDSGQKDASGQPIYFWHAPQAVPLLNNIVDLYSVHIYGFDKPVSGSYPDSYNLTSNYLKEIRKYTNKPIFIEEFGAGNGSATTDQNTVGSQELQKNAYTGVLKAMYDFKNRGVIGATAYLFAPRSNNPDGWSITENNGNTLLPAAYTFGVYSLK